MNFPALWAREFRSLLRYRAALVNPLAFMFLAVMLFAVGAPLQDNARAAFAPAVLWLVVLLTNMLSLDTLFRRDYESGVLEQVLCTAEQPLFPILIRIAVQWVGTGLLMTLLSPLLCLMLGLPHAAVGRAALALLIGTPALSLLGAMGAALTVGLSRGGVLLGLLVLPLFIPVLIFGSGAISAVMDGSGTAAPLYWLGFLSMLSLCVGPFAALAGLKIGLQMQ